MASLAATALPLLRYCLSDDMQKRNILVSFVGIHRRSHDIACVSSAKVCFRSVSMKKRRSSILAVLGISVIACGSSVRAEQEFTSLVEKVMPSVVNIAIEA